MTEEYGAAFSDEDILRLIQQKNDARLPDGAFAEYCGRVAFSELVGVKTVMLADAPKIINSVIEDTLWGTLSAARQATGYTYGTALLPNRALLACLDEPETPESVAVFAGMKEYVKALPAPLLNNEPEGGYIWAQKIKFLMGAYELVKQKEHFERRAFGNNTTTEDIQEFTEAMVHHMCLVKESIDAASNSDLAAVLGLIDANNILEEHIKFAARQNRRVASKLLPRLRGVPKELYEVMDEAGSDATMDGIRLGYGNVDEPLQLKFGQLQMAWEWSDINRALEAFPELKAQETRLTVIDALEDVTEASLPGIVSADTLAVRGLAAIIHHDIYINTPTSSSLTADKRQDGAPISYADVTLPRDMAPVTTVALLADIAQKLAAEDFMAVLQRIQDTIYSKDRAVTTAPNEWLVTLALLRKSVDHEARERIDKFIARSDFPHSAFQQIITGQTPGSIYLIPGGKIRVDTNLAKGWKLASSPASLPEAVAPSEPLAHMTRYAGPDKGTLAAPGKQPTRRERKKAKRSSQDMPTEVPMAPERSEPRIILPNDSKLLSLGQEISATDLALVKQAIIEHREHGRHQLLPLRGRDRSGLLRYKMRVNGKDGGIRVILTHRGNQEFDIVTIQYRGSVYKTALFD